MSLSYTVSEILVEKRRFEFTPPLFGLPLGVIWSEFHGDFCRQKTRVPGLSHGVVSVILGVAIIVQLRLVTDGQTDGRSDKHMMTANTVLA